MGKTLRAKTNKQPNNIKQETVSMANLEVVSAEDFQLRLDGMSMSSCLDCLKERAKSTTDQSRGRKRRRSTQIRLNSPIVVRLQDTIKVSVKSKLRTSPKSSDQESEELELSSDESSPVQPSRSVRQPKSLLASSGRYRFHGSQKATNLSAKWPASLASFSNDKNFNAFLSAIERVHQKDRGAMLCLENLEEYVRLTNDKSTALFLNNSVNCRGSATDKEQSRLNLCRSLELIAGDNVDLICNDLSNKNSVVDSDEISEDSERSEQSSEISSSEESITESDLSSGSESVVEELCQDELDRLTDYTTGFPLTRYECPPHDCPECLAYIAYAQYANGDYYKVDSIERDDIATDSEYGDDLSENQTQSEPSCKVTVTGEGKVTVSIANLFARSKQSSKTFSCPNSVCVDLTDTDVSLSIQYHPEAAVGEHTHQQVCGDWGVCWYPVWATMGMAVPWPMPYYMMLMPVHWLPYTFPYPSIYSNPKPICVPRNLRCLNSQRLCMVPAHEIKNCKQHLFLLFIKMNCVHIFKSGSKTLFLFLQNLET